MSDELYHHGVKGMRWGVRRYQNADGTWTSAGKKRYGSDTADEETKQNKSQTRKKVAIGVAAGTATVAGVVLTAYLVKKMGNKNLSDVADKVEVGKEAVEKIMKQTTLASTPVKQLPTMKALQSGTESVKPTVEKVLESTKTIASTPVGQVSQPRVSISKPTVDIPSTYNFETLMKQNDELLKKMLADLAS